MGEWAIIASFQERDRRQRQLVDPQFSRMKEKMKVAHETGVRPRVQDLVALHFRENHLVSSLLHFKLVHLAETIRWPDVMFCAQSTAEFQRLRAETKLFLKKHGVGVLPVSFFQMVLLGLTISFSTPAIRYSDCALI